ncbi:hypothetical protein WDZ17_13285 [Pseudokineococcus basanitobsidens]|uniref:Uncharacterized protein n=1 Tax=Pseudokineococcus basanitobsidens TaxID=1926649 RepID=A0ABU8RMJ8_9ACTN
MIAGAAAIGALASAVVAAAPTPSPSATEGLRPGLEASDVGPGPIGFVATAAVVLVSILVLVNMVSRLRRMERRRVLDEQAEDERRRAAGEPPLPPDVDPPPRRTGREAGPGSPGTGPGGGRGGGPGGPR